MMRPAVLLLACLGSVFASCSSSTDTTVPPAKTRTLSLSASTLSFGDTRMGLCADTIHGAMAEQMVTITNSGNDSLRIDSVSVASPELRILGELSRSLAPNASQIFKVLYCPQAATAINSSITLYTNGTDSAKKTIAITGKGIQYIPYTSSSFTYFAEQLDTAGNPIGLPFVTSNAIINSGMVYQGKTDVSLTSDSTYFKVEDNGDVSIYFAGFPTYPQSNVVDSGWFTLPVASHQPTVRSKTVTFVDSLQKNVTLTTFDTARYLADTTITVDGQQLACSVVELARIAHYQQGSGEINVVGWFRGAFAPSIGFTVAQGHLSDRGTVVSGQKIGKLAGGGEGRVLTGYLLK